MNYKKLKVVIFTSIVCASFAFSTANAGSTLLKVKVGKSKAVLSSLAARSFAVQRFGSSIEILSNRKLKSSGCRRIVIKTALGVRETLKICDKNKKRSRNKIAK